MFVGRAKGSESGRFGENVASLTEIQYSGQLSCQDHDRFDSRCIELNNFLTLKWKNTFGSWLWGWIEERSRFEMRKKLTGG